MQIHLYSFGFLLQISTPFLENLDVRFGLRRIPLIIREIDLKLKDKKLDKTAVTTLLTVSEIIKILVYLLFINMLDVFTNLNDLRTPARYFKFDRVDCITLFFYKNQ